MADKPLILLASRSPRRSHLLREAGLPFRVVAPGVESGAATTGLSPAQHALELAEAKALGAGVSGESGLLLACDTVVSADGRVLGKPRDRDEARRFLELLGGRRHEVCTAAVLVPVRDGEIQKKQRTAILERSVVEMRLLDSTELERYLDTGEWRDKAGGYGIQAGAGSFMRVVEGYLDTVVGMPLAQVRACWERFAGGEDAGS